MKVLPVDFLFHITMFSSAYDYQWDSTFTFAGETHPAWEIVCVLSGKVEIAEDESVFALQAGNVICHAPMEFHSIRSAGGSLPHVLVMSFYAEGVLPSHLTEGVFYLEPMELEAYQKLFFRIFRAYHAQNSKPYETAELASSLIAFLIHLSARSPQGVQSKTTGAEEYRHLVESMQRYVCQNLTLSQLAAKNAMSIGTVKNLFRTYAGVSPMTYYAHLRGRESIRLLQTGMEIRQIAEVMHFSSPNYFSCFFKRLYGVPPGKYRGAL